MNKLSRQQRAMAIVAAALLLAGASFVSERSTSRHCSSLRLQASWPKSLFGHLGRDGGIL
jgi:hypothetical protein